MECKRESMTSMNTAVIQKSDTSCFHDTRYPTKLQRVVYLAKVAIRLEHISKNSRVWWPQGAEVRGALSTSMLHSELDLLVVLELSRVMISTRCASGCSVVFRLLKSSK